MAIELVRAKEEHVAELARIFYEAFARISQRHGFPTDIVSMDFAMMGMKMFVTRPDIYGVAAVDGGKVIGHNFVQISDAVGGVGPICVDPDVQAKGVGRMLMKHIVEWSQKNHGPQVRLLQDTFNMTSLSLYLSVGYALREPILLMNVKPAEEADATVRPLTAEDVEAADLLCKRVYKVSRKNELAGAIAGGPAMGIVPRGRFIKGKLTCAMVPGFFGFAVATTHEDLLTTAQQAARGAPALLQQILLPLRDSDVPRKALGRGFKSVKMLSMMSIGPYQSPEGVWAPSIAY